MFAAWRAYSRFKSEHREFRKRTRAAKTARIIQLCGPSFDSRHTYPPNRRSLDCNCGGLKVRYGRHSRHLLVSGSSIPHCMPPRRTRHLTQHRRTCPMFSLSHRRMRSSLTLPCLKSFIVYCDCHRTRLPKDLATSSAWVLGARALAPWLHRTFMISVRYRLSGKMHGWVCSLKPPIPRNPRS